MASSNVVLKWSLFLKIDITYPFCFEAKCVKRGVTISTYSNIILILKADRGTCLKSDMWEHTVWVFPSALGADCRWGAVSLAWKGWSRAHAVDRPRISCLWPFVFHQHRPIISSRTLNLSALLGNEMALTTSPLTCTLWTWPVRECTSTFSIHNVFFLKCGTR